MLPRGGHEAVGGGPGGPVAARGAGGGPGAAGGPGGPLVFWRSLPGLAVLCPEMRPKRPKRGYRSVFQGKEGLTPPKDVLFQGPNVLFQGPAAWPRMLLACE